MGFWQGLNEGLAVVREERNRKQELEARRQEIEEERRIRREELMLQRKFQLEDWEKQMTLKQQEILLPLVVAREQRNREAEALRSKGEAFIRTRFEGLEDDPRVQALRDNPVLAAQLSDLVNEREKDLYEKGFKPADTVPLSGNALLEMAMIYAPDSGGVILDLPSADDIISGGMLEPEAFTRTVADLTYEPSQGSVGLKPEAYFTPDAKLLEEGRAAFDQEILRLANQYIADLEANAVDEDGNKVVVDEANDIRAMIEGYTTEGSAEKFALMDLFGPQAFANLATTDNPYIQNLENDPQLGRYSTQYKLQIILTDPEATEEEKARAQELLRRLGAG